VDGNKRVGVLVALALLDLNEVEAFFSDEDVVQMGMELASGQMSDKRLLKLFLEREKDN
jgi:death-on-curing protein